MDSKKFEIICELMDELKEEMQYGSDELGERLGRKKPEVEVAKVEIEAEPFGDSEEIEVDPDDELKDRLMKLRG